MRDGSRTFCALTGLLAAPLLLSATAPGQTVEVDVTALRSSKGVVAACLTPDATGFPDCSGDSRAFSLTAPARQQVTLTFHSIPPGRYAIALLHDENDNGKADRALGVIPREGFGFSRNAKIRMGPPNFSDAAFEVGGSPVRQTIRMRYLF